MDEVSPTSGRKGNHEYSISLRELIEQRFDLTNQRGDERMEFLQSRFSVIENNLNQVNILIERSFDKTDSARTQLLDLWCQRYTALETDLDNRFRPLEATASATNEHTRNLIDKFGALDKRLEAYDRRLSGIEKFVDNLQGKMWGVGAIIVLVQVALHVIPNLFVAAPIK